MLLIRRWPRIEMLSLANHLRQLIIALQHETSRPASFLGLDQSVICSRGDSDGEQIGLALSP
jgi:fatty acid/phospholipid biosynthesis enzyme